MQVIFNHIPKTGGITFRSILFKKYKAGHVFFIDSRNISASIQILRKMPVGELEKYKAIAGHGADFITEIIEKPFRVTILREPIQLFISQYIFLKTNKGTIFFDDVRQLKNIENYLDYAIEKGQDNLLVRYLSGSMEWLIKPELPIPKMEEKGSILIKKAKQALTGYDAVLNLSTFDKGVFAISQKLGWKQIPIYRPQNQNRSKMANLNLSHESKLRLNHVLRFDIDLYKWFLKSELDIANQANANQVQFQKFILRQKILNFVGSFIKN